MAAVETEIINRSHLKPLTWKRYIDDVKQRGNIKQLLNSAFVGYLKNSAEFFSSYKSRIQLLL